MRVSGFLFFVFFLYTGAVKHTSVKKIKKQHRNEDSLGGVITLLSLTFAFILGVGIYAFIGGAVIHSPTATSTPKVVPPPIVYERGPENIVITDSPREQIVADVSIALIKKIAPELPTRPMNFLVTNKNGEKRHATTREFFASINTRPLPASLALALENTFDAVLTNSTSTGIAFIIQVNDTDAAFAGALEWEKNMGADMIPFFHPLFPRKNIFAVSERGFIDERIDAGDVRTLYDNDGRVLIIYGWRSDHTLLIASSLEAFRIAIK